MAGTVLLPLLDAGNSGLHGNPRRHHHLPRGLASFLIMPIVGPLKSASSIAASYWASDWWRRLTLCGNFPSSALRGRRPLLVAADDSRRGSGLSLYRLPPSPTSPFPMSAWAMPPASQPDAEHRRQHGYIDVETVQFRNQRSISTFLGSTFTRRAVAAPAGAGRA